jgi:hypothetical protein
MLVLQKEMQLTDVPALAGSTNFKKEFDFRSLYQRVLNPEKSDGLTLEITRNARKFA